MARQRKTSERRGGRHRAEDDGSRKARWRQPGLASRPSHDEINLERYPDSPWQRQGDDVCKIERHAQQDASLEPHYSGHEPIGPIGRKEEEPAPNEKRRFAYLLDRLEQIRLGLELFSQRPLAAEPFPRSGGRWLQELFPVPPEMPAKTEALVVSRVDYARFIG